MKRYISIIALSLILLVGCSSANAQESLPHHYGSFNEVIYMPGTRLFFETTLDGLESRATHIVRGRIGNDARIVYQHSDPYDPSRITRGDNTVSLEIFEVIAGNLTVGETISILEPYYIIDGVFFTFADYMPSTAYQEYIFFLSAQLGDRFPENLRGRFPVVNDERGRFPVLNDTRADIQGFSSADLGLGTYANAELYMRLWQEVIDAYMN